MLAARPGRPEKEHGLFLGACDRCNLLHIYHRGQRRQRGRGARAQAHLGLIEKLRVLRANLLQLHGHLAAGGDMVPEENFPKRPAAQFFTVRPPARVQRPSAHLSPLADFI